MFWHSQFFKYFPNFVMIYRVKGYSVVNEAEVYFFLEFPCFSYDPMDIGNLVSCVFAFSKPSLCIWKLLIHVLLKARLKEFEDNFIKMRDEHNCMVFEHSLALPFFGIGIKTEFFQSCGHC